MRQEARVLAVAYGRNQIRSKLNTKILLTILFNYLNLKLADLWVNEYDHELLMKYFQAP